MRMYGGQQLWRGESFEGENFDDGKLKLPGVRSRYGQHGQPVLDFYGNNPSRSRNEDVYDSAPPMRNPRHPSPRRGGKNMDEL